MLLGENPAALRNIDASDWLSPLHLMSLEREICGLTHPELGAMACERWHLPELLVSVVRQQHDRDVQPERSELDALLAAVDFADQAMFPLAVPGSHGYEDADLETLERDLVPRLPPFFDFDAASLQLLLQSAARESNQICAVIGL